MLEALLLIVGAVGGGGFVAYRLKGARTMRQTLRAIVIDGGGPGVPDK